MQIRETRGKISANLQPNAIRNKACFLPLAAGGAAAQGPHGQIKTERLYRPGREVSLLHEGCVRRSQWRAAVVFEALAILTASRII